MLAGSLSGIMASFIVYPLELMRTRLAIRANDSNNIFKIIQNTKKEMGIMSFYRGLRLNILGIILYKGFAFYFFENILHSMNIIFKESHLNHGISAAMAGLLG